MALYSDGPGAAETAMRLFEFIRAHDKKAAEESETRDGALKLLAECACALAGLFQRK